MLHQEQVQDFSFVITDTKLCVRRFCREIKLHVITKFELRVLKKSFLE